MSAIQVSWMNQKLGPGRLVAVEKHGVFCLTFRDVIAVGSDLASNLRN